MGLLRRCLGQGTGDQFSEGEYQRTKPLRNPGRFIELGYRGSEWSFDAFIREYRLTDPALIELAAIVRAADIDATYLAPEAAGLQAIAEGFRLNFADDGELLEHELLVFDALYAYCRQRVVREINRTRCGNTSGGDSADPDGVATLAMLQDGPQMQAQRQLLAFNPGPTAP